MEGALTNLSLEPFVTKKKGQNESKGPALAREDLSGKMTIFLVITFLSFQPLATRFYFYFNHAISKD